MSKTALLLISTLISHSAYATVHSPPKTLEDGLYEVAAEIITYEEFLKAPYFTPGKLIHFVQTNPTSPLSESGIVMLGYIKTRPAIHLIFDLLLHSDQQVRRLAWAAMHVSAQNLNPLDENERLLMLSIEDRCVYILNRYVQGSPVYDSESVSSAILAICMLRFKDEYYDLNDKVRSPIMAVFDSGLLPVRTYEATLKRLRWQYVRVFQSKLVYDILVNEEHRLKRMIDLSKVTNGQAPSQTKSGSRRSLQYPRV